MVVSYCLFEVASSVIDTGDDFRITLSVGSPEDDDLVEIVIGLEVANVSANLLQVRLLVVAW